jgi:hypothetical protein
LIDQEKVHKQCLSDDPKERMQALEQLKFNFSLMADKQYSWNDLIDLTNDEDWDEVIGLLTPLVMCFPTFQINNRHGTT